MTSASTVLDDIGYTSVQIKIDGTDLSEVYASAILAIRINIGASTTGRATLRFNDAMYQLSKDNPVNLAAEVVVSVNRTEIFAGVVTGTALEHSGSRAPEYVVTVDDRSCLMALSHQITSWETVTAADVLKKLAGNSNLSLSTDAQSAVPTSTYDYLVQQGSDLAFLDSLTRRIHCVWRVVGKTLNVTKGGADRSTSVAVKLGGDLLDFSVRASGLRPTEVHINGWDPAAKTDIKGSGASAAALTSSATFANTYGGTGPDTAFGRSEAAGITVNHSNPNTQGEATLLATSLNAMLAADAVIARGTTNINPAITPEVNVEVDGAGAANGVYAVTEVEHNYSQRGFYTKFVAGPLRQSLLVDAFAATPPDPGFTNFGLASAIVTNVGDAKNPGMVKVKFTGGDDQLISAWARVVSFGGGDQRGSVFLPEIKDEVLIGFERGDTRHPVVLGGLFGGQAALAAGTDVFADGKVAYRRITSREGNVIELSDGSSADKKHVKLSTPGGQVLRLGDDKGEITYASGLPFSIKIGSASIEFDDQGNITIKGMKITIQASQDLDISAGMNATIKGTTKLAMQGLEAELKGDTQVTVQGGATAALKGAMVNIN